MSRVSANKSGCLDDLDRCRVSSNDQRIIESQSARGETTLSRVRDSGCTLFLSRGTSLCQASCIIRVCLA